MVIRSADDLFQELLSVDESHRIEAKRASQIDRAVLASVCAFANEPGLGGGYLLLGVAHDQQDLFNNAYRVEGLVNPDKLQSYLVTQCANTFNWRNSANAPTCWASSSARRRTRFRTLPNFVGSSST